MLEAVLEALIFPLALLETSGGPQATTEVMLLMQVFCVDTFLFLLSSSLTLNLVANWYYSSSELACSCFKFKIFQSLESL